MFAPDYHLASLNEIKDYVNTKYHLPDIPSEAEVDKNCVNLGEMQAKLLAKIEELTLHMIAAEEKNRQLQQSVDRVEMRDNSEASANGDQGEQSSTPRCHRNEVRRIL